VDLRLTGEDNGYDVTRTLTVRRDLYEKGGAQVMRKLRLIWKLTEPVGEKGSVCTYGTDLVVMPMTALELSFSRTGFYRTDRCEWLEDDNGKIAVIREAGDISSRLECGPCRTGTAVSVLSGEWSWTPTLQDSTGAPSAG
jgi:hypothetical protein